MTTRTAERAEFLASTLLEALGGASYWLSIVSEDGDTFVIHDDADSDDPDEASARHTVTPDTIARGLNKLAADGCNYSNMGYRNSPYGDTRARLGKFNRSNGTESDADAWDFDAALQVGIFGEVLYS